MKKFFIITVLILIGSLSAEWNSTLSNQSTGTDHQQGTNDGYMGVNFTVGASNINLTKGYFWSGDTCSFCYLKTRGGTLLANITRDGDTCIFPGGKVLNASQNYSIGEWCNPGSNFGFKNAPDFPISNTYTTIYKGYDINNDGGDSNRSWGLMYFEVQNELSPATGNLTVNYSTGISSVSGANSTFVPPLNLTVNASVSGNYYFVGGIITEGNASVVSNSTLGSVVQILDTTRANVQLNAALVCRNISAAGKETLTQNLTINSSTCFNVTANNVEIDCNGYWITGNNTAGTYGIYSSANNTTVRNCNIVAFSSGIFYSHSSNGIINNVSSNTTLLGAFPDFASGIILSNGSNNNVVANSTLYSLKGNGLLLFGGNSDGTNCPSHSSPPTNNTVYNIYSHGRDSMFLECSNSNHYSNFTTIGESYSGVDNQGIGVATSWNNTFENFNATGRDDGFGSYGILLYNGGGNNTFINGSSTGATRGTWSDVINTAQTGIAFIRVNSTGGTGEGVKIGAAAGVIYTGSTVSSSADAAFLTGGANGNITNNTFISASNNLLEITATGNKVCWNNFTSTTGYYISDTGGSSTYNSTLCGGEGNIYLNVFNGSVVVRGTANSTGFPALKVGSSGAGVPYNNSTSGGKLLGNVVDNAPLTNASTVSCGTLSVAGATSTLTQSISANGSTCFNVSAANITIDCNGYSITGNNSSGTYGIYTNQFNTTIKNCNISNFQNGIRFSGATNGTISNTNTSTSTSSGRGIYLNTASNNNITNSRGASTSFYGIDLSAGSYNTITNSVGNATLHGIIIYSTNSNAIINSTGISTGSNGIYINSASNNNITNSTGISASQPAIYITSASNNNNLVGTIGNSSSGTAISIDGGSNVSIDCQGKSLIGTNTTSTYGIYSNQFNTTVKNCNISNFATGIYFTTASSYGTISNVTMAHSFGAAAASSFSGTGHVLSGITMNTTSSAGSAIWLLDCPNCRLENSTSSTGASYNIRLTGTDNNVVLYNVTPTNVGSGAGAIHIAGGSNVTVDCGGSSITGTNTTGTYGVYTDQPNTTIKNCNISNFATGIYFTAATNGSISGNNLSSTFVTGYGIYFAAGSNYNTINGNNATGYYSGMRLATATNNAISNNQFTSNSAQGALYLGAATDNTITNSTVLSSTGYGVYIESNSHRNTITNITSSGSAYGVYNAGGSNVSIDCAGASITGTNASSTYGVYSNQFNTTISNCNISNFENAIYFSGATNGTISNVTAGTSKTDRYAVYLLNGANYNTIANSTIMPIGTARGVTSASSHYNTITGTTITAPNLGFYFNSANGTIIANSTITSAGFAGLYLVGSHHNTVANSTITGEGVEAIEFAGSGNTNNTFRNNTLIAATSAIALLDATSGLNTFYWNNFTSTSGYYVQDLNGSNYYNSSTEGNIWANVINGSVNIGGTAASTLPGLKIGTRGSGYPYTNVTSSGKFSCKFTNCQDNFPLTNLTSNVTGNLTITPPSNRDVFRMGYIPSFCAAPTNQTGASGIYTYVNLGNVPINVVFAVNQSNYGFDLTVGNSSTCTSGTNLTTSNQTIYTAVPVGGSQMFWAWANANSSLVSLPRFKIIAGAT